MTTVAFDTLAYVRKLESAGVPRAQAEAQADAFSAAMREGVAGKADIERLENKLDSFRDDVDRRFGDIDHRFRDLEQRMTIKLGGLIIAATGILLAAFRYLPPHP